MQLTNERTALIVVDRQNGFCHDRGSFAGLGLDSGDFVIDKSRCSSFYGTRLEPNLTSLGITRLVVAGVTTNMCVETTVRDALQRDHEVLVVGDACAELEEERHRFALNTMGFGFARVVEVDDVVAAWAGAAVHSV